MINIYINSTTYKISVTIYETIHVAIGSSVNSNIIDRKIGASYTIAEVYQLPRELTARCTSESIHPAFVRVKFVQKLILSVQ